jgi:hypothetical protein
LKGAWFGNSTLDPDLVSSILFQVVSTCAATVRRVVQVGLPLVAPAGIQDVPPGTPAEFLDLAMRPNGDLYGLSSPYFLVKLKKNAHPQEGLILSFVQLPVSSRLVTISFDSGGQLWGAETKSDKNTTTGVVNRPNSTLFKLKVDDGSIVSSKPLSRRVRNIHFGCDDTLYAGTDYLPGRQTGAGYFAVVNIHTGAVDVPAGAQQIFSDCFKIRSDKTCGSSIVGISDSCVCPSYKRCETHGTLGGGSEHVNNKWENKWEKNKKKKKKKNKRHHRGHRRM